jgi:hypothetical protein
MAFNCAANDIKNEGQLRVIRPETSSTGLPHA